MNSLEVADAAAAAVQQTAQRVTLSGMLNKIAHEQYVHPEATPHMTICIMTVSNGYTLVGQSTPADPANFNAELGRQFAREDCIRQMWPLEGYALRERLSAA